MSINLITALFLLLQLPAAAFAGAYADLAGLAGRAEAVPVPAVSSPDPVYSAAYGPENPAPEREWTVMAFINGSNNLASNSLGDANSIARAGASKEVNLAVEYSVMYKGKTSLARRAGLFSDGLGGTSVEIYGDWKDRDMGDWRNLAGFVRWAKASFPARRYLLIVQNHGGGFIDETYKPRPADKGISYDEVSGNYIKTPELARVLAETGPVDMLVMNACNMQMAEVAYELGPAAGVIVASEETEYSTFHQYPERLAYLKAHAYDGTESIAAGFVELRRAAMKPGSELTFGYNNSTYTYTVTKDMANTLSALRAGGLGDLPAALDRWTRAVRLAGEKDAVRYAIASSVRLGVLKPAQQPYSRFVDLLDFTQRVGDRAQDPRVKERTAGLQLALSGAMLASSAMNVNASGVDYSKTLGGLGIKMIPLTPAPQSVIYPHHDVIVDTPYEDLKFAADSGWDEFLDWAAGIYYRPR